MPSGTVCQRGIRHVHVYCICFHFRDGRFGSTVGQIGLEPKWDKSGTFSDQISVGLHLAHRAKCTEI